MKTFDQKQTSENIESWSKPAGRQGGDLVIREETHKFRTTVIADATGHGEDAARIAAYIQPAIAHEIKGEITTHHLRRWHGLVYDRFQADSWYVCITILQLDLDTQVLSIINAGNPDVLIHRGASPVLEKYGSTGMPLGLLSTSEWRVPRIETTYLWPTDYVICFTDGVVDCQNAAGDRFGLGRVYSAVQTASIRSPLRAVQRGLLRFLSPEVEQDDASIIVLRGCKRFVA